MILSRCVYLFVPGFFFVLFCGSTDMAKVVIISEKREGNGRNKIVKF